MNQATLGKILVICWLLLLLALAGWWAGSLVWPPSAIKILAGTLILPLAIILPPVLRGSEKASATGTLLLIPYMGWGLTEAVANPDARGLAAFSTFTAMACFAVLILWLRALRSG